jgi:signal transduction histidine kinase
MRIRFLNQAAACVCFLFFQISGLANTLVPAQALTNAHIANYIEVFEDKNNAYSVEDVSRNSMDALFQRWNGNASALELGHSRSAWWLKIILHNDGKNSIHRFLEIANSHLADVNFYEPVNDGGYKEYATGNLKPFDTRQISTRYFVFPVDVGPDVIKTYYIQIRSSTQLFIPVKLWDERNYQKNEKNNYAFQSFYFGIVLVLSLLSLFYFFALRDLLYIKYLALLLAVTFTVYSLNGMLKEYVIQDSMVWSQHAAAFGAAFSIALLLNFMRHFLGVKESMPMMDAIIKRMVIIYPFPMLAISLYPSKMYVIAGQFITMTVIIFAMVFALWLAFKKIRMAYFFVFAYSIPFVVLLINLLSSAKFIPQVWDVPGSTQVAFLIEMLVFSLALIDRTYQMRKQNEASKNTIISLQLQLVESLREKENKLENLIEKRYKELRHFIDMLSHEIKTPMSVIRMFIEMGNQRPQLKKNALTAIQDIDTIIDQCIETDQLENESISANPKCFSINILVSDIIELKLNATRININSTVIELLHTDPMILTRTISNLIDNALKYSPSDSEILININEKTIQSQSGVEFEIRNTPDVAGFPDPMKIFEKYYRSQGAHTKTGSGLGLHLVKSFADLLGAKIDYCVENKQVVFKLWIPR